MRQRVALYVLFTFVLAVFSGLAMAGDKPLVVNKYELPIYVSQGDNFHIRTLLTKENAPGANTYVGLGTCKPGTKIPLHDHGDRFEALYIMSGGGLFTIDDKQYRVGPESFVYFPAHSKHCFVNDLDQDMVFVQIYGPAGHEEMRFFKWPTWDKMMEKAKSGDVLK
jgi:mannose-6-phosphate isomerase-like protein (cupin superfamily)